MTDTSNTSAFDPRPIGLFDSGVGGLTVLKSLVSKLPNESFLYLGDTARLPYGSKSPQTIDRYLRQNIRFLLDQNVKAVVVACNSASTVLLDHTATFPIPVYNVIEPGAETALKASHTKRIGVLGTKATVNAKAYVRTIHRIDKTATVFQQACPLLVPLVEEGWEEDPLTNLVVYRYVTPIVQAGVDTLILGCTHYPALKAAIARVAGPSIQLVDSAAAIAELIRSDIARGNLGASPGGQTIRIMATDVSPSFAEVAARLMSPIVLPEISGVDIGAA